MRTAYNLIRNGPHYRAEAFTKGLEQAGFQVRRNLSHGPTADDLLVIWNRYGEYEQAAAQFERIGATVLVVENGYHGTDKQGRRRYAISIGQHHHGGAIPMHTAITGLEIQPWQVSGKEILICAQRGIGSELMRSPPDWAERTAHALSKKTIWPIRIREHPGKFEPSVALSEDLKRANACVIWSSCCGIEALIAGVPVFYDAPRWIAQAAAIPLRDVLTDKASIDYPSFSDREKGLIKAFSNQWDLDQIASGHAFLNILSRF